MFCQNCGKEIIDGQSSCSACGVPIANNAYQQPYGTPQPIRNPMDGLGYSIAALVLGCCGFVLFENLIFAVCSILAIIFGSIGRKKSIWCYGKASGMATAGVVLGIIGLILSVLAIIIGIIIVACLNFNADYFMY